MLRSACAQEEASSGDEHERLLGKSFIVDGRSILDSELYAWIPERMRQNESWWCIRQEVKDRVKDQEGKGKGEAGKLKDLQRQMEQSMGERMEVEAKIEKKKSKLEGLQRKSKSQEEAEKARSIISSLAKSEQKAKEHEERIGKLCGQINNLAEHLHSQEEENGPCAGQYRAALHDVCGPMLPWMYLAWAVHFVAMLLPVPTYYFFTQCAGEGDTYAEYSPWLWAPFVVWVSIKLLLEWKCFTYIVVPIIAYIKSYRFLNLIDVAFELWLPITFAKSLILNMDVWAQGLYLAKFIRRARDCQGQSKIQTAWEHAWDESLFYGFRPGSNLNFLAGLAFATLVLQQFVYLLRALPVPMKIWSIDYKCGSEPNGYTVPICCTRVWHADAVKTLSSSIRMVFIMDGQRRYAINRADHKLKLGLLGLQGESIANYFHILKMDMRLMFFDSIFVNLLQSCAKLQIQTSLWALYLFADGKNSNVDHRIDLFTLMLAHITSFMGLCSVLMDCLQIRDNRMKVRKEQENTMHTAAFREYDKLAMWERSVLAVLVLQCLFQALCLWKFLKSFQCDYALWNFAEGCVDLQGVA